MSRIRPISKPPIWRQTLTIVEGLLLLAIATVALSLLITLAGLPKSELALYLVVKGGFAVILMMVFSFQQGWRRYGFGAGLRFRYWLYLLPLWIGAAASLAQGIAVTTPLDSLGWVAVGLAVAFGEEGLFRGIILDALLPNGPRAAAIVSSVLFGLSHLAGITEIDYRIILAQVLFAAALGLTLAWVRLASASIWPCILAHAVLDATGLLAAAGVEDAIQYSPSAMIWIVSFGVLSLIWGSYLIWRKPMNPNLAGAAAVIPDPV